VREILFRGKDKNGDWVKGSYINVGDDKIHRIWITFTEQEKQMHKGTAIEDAKGYWEDVIPETVGQFTGLYDKNGKRIFEGDIVKGAWNTVFVVYYDECYLQFRSKKADGYGRELDYYGESNTCEVIGNIHDNPELLEREDG